MKIILRLVSLVINLVMILSAPIVSGYIFIEYSTDPGVTIAACLCVFSFMVYVSTCLRVGIPIESWSGAKYASSQHAELIEEHGNKKVRNSTVSSITKHEDVSSIFYYKNCEKDSVSVSTGFKNSMLYVFFVQLLMLVILFVVSALMIYASQGTTDNGNNYGTPIVTIGLSTITFLLAVFWWVSRIIMVRDKAFNSKYNPNKSY